MKLIGHLHPLFVHFPIALVLIAAVSEVLAALQGGRHWRVAAVVNVRVGAIFAIVTAIVGWQLAQSMGIEGIDETRLLEWHRWLGTAAACATVFAALTTIGERTRARGRLWSFRVALFSAALLVALGGHVGALLVWGENFLRP
jgi:uncharacterized membrane protein